MQILGTAFVKPQPHGIKNKHDVLKESAEKLHAAFRILDRRTLQPVYENPSAKKYPLDETARQGLQLLAKRLEADKSLEHTERLEWNAHKNYWLHRLLLRAGSWYWLKEERTCSDPVNDPDLVLLFRTQDKTKRLEAFADILEQKWGISRVRFYQADALYGDCSNNSEPHYLLQALWERGEGFSEPGKEAWLNDEFLLEENKKAESIFQSSRPSCRNSPVGDTDKSAKRGSITVKWGNAKSRVEIPIWNIGKSFREPLGLLALDRRTDHLSYYIARKDDAWGTAISDEEMERMSGLLDAVKPMLQNYILELRKERLQNWERKLSSIIQTALQEQNARSALAYALKQIYSNWETQGVHLRDIYLVRIRLDELLEPWAGFGPVWEKRRGRLYLLESPFKEALEHITVIHDFPEWLEQRNPEELHKIDSLFGEERQALKKLGSWLGIPLKQANQTFGLLIIGVEKRHYFKESRAKAFEIAAARLMPLLLWGLGQDQREWLIRALAHEYREPVNHLLNLTKSLPEEERKQAEAILEYQTAVTHNLRMLAKEFSGELPEPKKEETLLGGILDRIVTLLHSLHPNKPINLFGNIKELYLPATEKVLYQIFFSLLENACKYGLPNSEIRIEQIVKEEKQGIRICNFCAEPIPLRDRKRIFAPFQRGSNATVGKGGGIGLAVAWSLAKRHDILLELTEPGKEDNPLICFTLTFNRK